MKMVFDGRNYGRFGFNIEDGRTVCYSFYEWEQHLKRLYFWRPGGSCKLEVKNYLMYRDNDRCHYCLRYLTNREATVDHFFPPEFWHIDEKDLCDSITNLVIACEPCNFFKGKKSPIDLKIYQRDNLSLWIKIIKFCKRNITNVKLILRGTKTLRGEHKGMRKYNSMSDRERKEARDARFKQDYSGGGEDNYRSIPSRRLGKRFNFRKRT